MSTARLAQQMRMAVAGARAFHAAAVHGFGFAVIECPIPAFYTGSTAGSWSRNDLQNRKPGSRQTSVYLT